MKKAETTYITVGKLGSTYGVRGWLKVSAYTEPTTNILDYSPWYLSGAKDDWAIVDVEEGRVHGNGIIVKLVAVNTPEQARLLTGKTIAVLRSQLPSLNANEYYWSDLVGLTVINKNGAILGKVIYLMATGANDVLVVKGDKEIAIPYIFDDVILSIDLTKQEIHVDWEWL